MKIAVDAVMSVPNPMFFKINICMMFVCLSISKIDDEIGLDSVSYGLQLLADCFHLFDVEIDPCALLGEILVDEVPTQSTVRPLGIQSMVR